MEGNDLTAAEAAARLGVKRATLYAYVSRGLIHRRVAMDGRTSIFDSQEVESFRSGRRRRTDGQLDAVLTTALTRVDDHSLTIRGENLVELVKGGASYEAIVELLWGGRATWDLDPDARKAVQQVQSALPVSSSSLDRLRATVATMSAIDPLRFDLTPGAVHIAGSALLEALVVGLPLRGRDQSSGGLSDMLWPRLTSRRPTAATRDALNAAMALLVDHGLAASTFGVRIAASVRGDPYSIASTGLGVVGGTLHGAASRGVHDLLENAYETRDIAGSAGETYRRQGANPGFGHTVYRVADPRYVALMVRIEAAWERHSRLETVRAVRAYIEERTGAIPNVDLALGSLTWLADMDPDAGEAIFAIARTAGWIAHAVEEYDEEPLRFRPRARYVGLGLG